MAGALVQLGGNLYPVLSEVSHIKTTISPAPNWRGICGTQYFEVPERMRADGTELTPLDADAAREAAQILKAAGIEAVAVLFLHSYRAPQHEVRMCEILHETDANWFITASHELSREYREYERASTTVANAYVGPIVSTYLGDLEQRLAQRGFHGSLMIMQSNGGLQDVVTARRQCIQMMESGPAGGVVGTMAVCEALGLEAAEAKAPMLVVQRALRQDSGGAGTWRGGLGVIQEVRVLTHAMFDSRVERTLCPPWGLRGGKDAVPNRVSVIRKDGVLERFPTGKVNPLRLDQGDGYAVETGVGGGFGDPLARPAE